METEHTFLEAFDVKTALTSGLKEARMACSSHLLTDYSENGFLASYLSDAFNNPHNCLQHLRHV